MEWRLLVLTAASVFGVADPVAVMAQPAIQSGLDVTVLFATNCGFCHGDGGRAAGKGPQLMGTTRSDEFLRDRIKNGKEGAMPAFGQMFSDGDINAIISYIHNLRPEGQG